MAFSSVTQVSCRFRQSLHLHPYLVRMLDDRQVRAAGLDDQGGLDAIEIVDGRVFHIALGCFPRRHLHASAPIFQRSEEDTSALQSLMRGSSAVICLKKKTTEELR